MLRLLFVVFIIVAGNAHSENMRMQNECTGNALEFCVVILEGPIDAGAPARFRELLKDSEGFRIVFDSPGGNLEAGLRLGRIIREAGLRTEIGRAIPADGGIRRVLEIDGDAQCVSACAYAFLGGVFRTVPEKARLGFHRVSLPGNSDLPGEAGLTGGQLISALLIGYLVEMGVDARVFVAASNTPPDAIHFATADELIEFDLVTPRGFGPLFLEPYGNGVIAASRRQEPVHYYDTVEQITAYCRDGQARFLLTSANGTLTPDYEAMAEPFITVDGARLPALDVVIRNDGEKGYLDVGFAGGDIDLALRQPAFGVGVWLARAAGGYYGGELDLTGSGHDMLAAAFRFCI